jgi:hypothetical protein
MGKTPRDFGVVLLGFMLLSVWHALPWVVVVIGTAGGALIG